MTSLAVPAVPLLNQSVSFNASALHAGSKWILNSGHEIPVIGYGTYLIPPNVTAEAVNHAINHGFRMIDCAAYYGNEAEVADGMRRSGIPRDELFLTSKLMPSNNYIGAKAAVDRSLQVTGLSYLDLYLIHTPAGTRDERTGAWKAVAEAVKQQKVRSIGVSNFEIFELHHLEELESWINQTEASQGKGKAGVLSVLQVELHPWVNQSDVVNWAFQRGVRVEGWSPLVRAERFNETILHPISKKHSRSPAQVLLRWSLLQGYTPIPKAAQQSHMKENINVFDFELDEQDMKSLDTGIDEPYVGN